MDTYETMPKTMHAFIMDAALYVGKVFAGVYLLFASVYWFSSAGDTQTSVIMLIVEASMLGFLFGVLHTLICCGAAYALIYRFVPRLWPLALVISAVLLEFALSWTYVLPLREATEPVIAAFETVRDHGNLTLSIVMTAMFHWGYIGSSGSQTTENPSAHTQSQSARTLSDRRSEQHVSSDGST